VRDSVDRVAFLSNVKTITITDNDETDHAAVLCYFYDENGEWFRSYVKFRPYFFVSVDEEWIDEMIQSLERIFENQIAVIEVVLKTDLENVAHMAGTKTKYIKLSFKTIPVSKEWLLICVEFIEREEDYIEQNG
jgi:hypothetical protein